MLRMGSRTSASQRSSTVLLSSISRNMHHHNTATTQLVLYDIPSKSPRQAWSPNVWKVRLLLNYKSLDYRTEWIEYPALKSELSNLVPSNEQSPEYTVPTITFEDGTSRTESLSIAEEICRRWPKPEIAIHSDELTELDTLMPDLYRKIASTYLPLVPARILNKASYDYWHETRSARVGMSLARLQATTDVEQVWRAAAPNVKRVTEMLTANSSGPFFRGIKPSYADFVWGGFLMYMKMVGIDIYQPLVDASGNGELHKELLQALSPWFQRSS